MRLDGYIRVSRVGEREGESFISPAVQRERVAAMAVAQGHEIVEWHEDLDLSGSHSRRPGLQAALTRVDEGLSEGIIVWKLSRFGRSSGDIHRNLERLRAAGGELLTVEESINTSGAFGRFLLAITAGFAELEWEQRREGWATARERAVARGVHVASRAPTGYGRIPKGEQGAGRLVPDVGAEAVAEVFRRKARGASWRELAGVLEDAGVRTPYGSPHWTDGSLAGVIANRVYLGEARSGEFVQPGAHPAIVDEETWLLAQHAKRPRIVGEGSALLSGLLRCAGCRYVMKPDFMRDRDDEKLRIYRCRGRRAGGTCEARSSVLGRVIEPWVTERFFDGLGDVLAEAVRASGQLRDLEEAVEEAQRELVAYRDSAAAEVLGADSFGEGLRVRAQKLDRAIAALDRVRAEASGADLPDAATLRETWPELTVAEQRHLLGLGVDAIFLRRSSRQGLSALDERALILWRSEGPSDLPGPGGGVEDIRPFDWPA